MSTIEQIKRYIGRVSPVSMLLLAAPLLLSITACGELSVDKNAESLAGKELTKGRGDVIFPDSVPSVADGSVYWKQQDCSSCHGMDGKGIAGKCDVDLTNVEWMRLRKPIDQYRSISIGEGRDYEMPVLSDAQESGSYEPVLKREFKHPPYNGKLNRRQLWSTLFYTRSLAVPLLDKDEYNEIKAVFGGNCAVCHGARGAGDGDLNKGLVLQPAPANFTKFARFYDRTDEQIFDHIAHGIKWEGMPNFLGKVDTQKGVTFDAPYIWKLVQYVRNFAEDANYSLEAPKDDTEAASADSSTGSAVKESGEADAKKESASATEQSATEQKDIETTTSDGDGDEPVSDANQ